MKKLLFFCFLFSTLTSLQAKIWRVNNTGLPADFTTIQSAHDNGSVLAGDTLHIEPSPTSYGSLLATKKLIIIGNGYFLNQNQNLQANPLSSRMSYFDFDAGSSGSVIMGMEILGGVSGANCAIRVGNITVSRNYFPLGGIPTSLYFVRTTAAYSNVLISQNYFANGGITYSGSGTQSYNNIMILNNVISQINLPVYFSGSIMNNVLISTNNAADYFVIKNNICTNTSAGSVFTSATGSTISYNTSAGATGFPAGNNNSNSVVMSTVFVQTGSTDGYYVLKSGSPAIGTGESGIDRGIFGGFNPYILSGIPPVPSIYKLTAPTNSNGNQLNVIISTKTNN
ncbi:MAG: hypothetical protein K0S33_910 [Bacteroidetes bacterium]|jgi:hypothetical protein|nr:hypothetical protein [Bacteroidota bacterium]